MYLLGVSMDYRLSLDLGAKSIGWAIFKLDHKTPVALVKAGVRIFSDGREPDGTSKAVARREARSMRRRRDRMLARKERLIGLLCQYGFFPSISIERKALETLDPYLLRAKGLDKALTPNEFARAIFHLNQRRGFQSNRKTDKADPETGAMKTAIKAVRASLDQNSEYFQARTIGELLYKRLTDSNKPSEERTVRARFRQTRIQKDDGKTRIEKSYDLYIDRKMIANEFDSLWDAQANFEPSRYKPEIRTAIKDCLLFQRRLRPVKPGRCTLIPSEERSPLALPSTQRFRIYQELANLRLLQPDLRERTLTKFQRDQIATALENSSRVTFAQIRRKLSLDGDVLFNLEDVKRPELKGNTTSALLQKPEKFGSKWSTFSPDFQDEIVLQLVNEQSEQKLVDWLCAKTGVDEARAESLANTSLSEGYGSLSKKALNLILPKLQAEVVSFATAAVEAGFASHSLLDASLTGEILPELPYYGEPLNRHVAFGSGIEADPPEKRFGKIANPTVHVGLNQLRVVVNAIIKRYGNPMQVVVEVTRELKQSRDQRLDAQKRQAENQKRNARIRQEIGITLGIAEFRVSRDDIEKWILWEELGSDAASRTCPYTGEPISRTKLLSPEVETEHILPFARTLDDSLNNKTVAMRKANRFKENKTPWEAFGKSSIPGYDYQSIVARAEAMPKQKRYRFAADGMEQWLREDKGFLARALNDTSYLSRIAREYMSLVCPTGTWVIPGRLTGLLRRELGLNSVLDLKGEKNRQDHRHHAVDACVIGITDESMLAAFSRANERTRGKGLQRIVDDMPLPWATYLDDVRRVIKNIRVSHKPDHGWEGQLHNSTAYSLLGDGKVGYHKNIDGVRTFVEEKLSVIPIVSTKTDRHGFKDDGSPKPYKGYKGDSNYCIEIVRNEKGKWEGEVISTFEAAQAFLRFNREPGGLKNFEFSKSLSLSNRPLVMRLLINDMVRMNLDGSPILLRMVKVKGSGQIYFAEHFEANVDARDRDPNDPYSYISKSAGSLQKLGARRVYVLPDGVLKDSGFKG